MTTELWALVFIGVAWCVTLFMIIGLVMNLLKKVDRCEDKLMAMTSQFPHQAYAELQMQQMNMWQQSPQAEKAPHQSGTWESEAS